MKRRVLLSCLLVLLGLSLACAGATETLRNDSGKAASGVTITFSTKVRITSYDENVFSTQEPSGRDDEFTFSGGSLPSYRRFRISWTPSTAEIEEVKWEEQLYVTDTVVQQSAQIVPEGMPAPGTTSTERVLSPIARQDIESLSTGFPGSSIDYCLWDVWTWNGGEASQSNEAILSTNNSSEFSSAKLVTQYWLEGDFDVQVDYELLDGWSGRITGSGGYPRLSSSLGIYVDDSTLIDFARVRSDFSSTLNVYSSLDGGSLVERVSTSGSSGSLRGTRAGSLLTLYSRSGGAWREVARTTFVDDPVRIYLNSASLEVRKDSRMAFDNYTINEGTPARYSVWWWTEDYEYDPDFVVGGWICDYFAHREWNRF